jgi:carbon-monoxide dehydrogenase large subunit
MRDDPTSMSSPRGGIGVAVARVEDRRFLTGRGRFTDDFRIDGEARGYVLRSDHAHARIVSLDTAAAKAAPGVLAVLTAADLAVEGFGHLPCLRPVTTRAGSPMYQPPRPLLSGRFVRHVGDPVAFVVAETLAQARDAAALVEIDYEAVPAVTSLAQARAPDAPRIRPDCPGNRSFDFELGDRAAVDRAFAAADHVCELTLAISRVQPSPLEPRSAIGTYEPASDGYTLRACIQSPHRIRDALAKEVFRVPPTAIRVISPDMGGGFGNRNSVYPEHGLVLWAARRVGRPVRWTSDRSESFLCDDQARDNLTTAALALDRDGRFLGLRVRTAVGLGAYLATMGPGPAVNNVGCLAGVYRTPAIHVEVQGYFTNTTPTSAYRGAGRPEAIYVLERLIDTAARQIGVDPAELRRRNLITPNQLPFKTALTFTYDSGDFPGNLELALDRADYAGFERRRAEARARGRLRGIGIANAIESAGSPARPEASEIRLDRDGRARVVVGTRSHGQGHETVYRQLLSDYLGLDFADVEIVEGDTDLVDEGSGTFGSRSITLGGGALKAAAEAVIENGRRIAAERLEAAVADIEFDRGTFIVAGTDRRLSLAAVAGHAATAGEPLGGAASYAPDAVTFPNGCHVSEVEIDPETGTVTILRYLVVEDFGVLINPMLVEGQVHGGVTQGIGQILMEQTHWDPKSGQLLTGSFMDYALPRADHLPFFEIASNPHPTSKNSLGVKGAGEAGSVGALACLMNAIVDALAPAGVGHLDMPATPERIWRALRAAATSSV